MNHGIYFLLLDIAFIRGRFLKKSGGTVNPREIFALVNHPEESPMLPEWAVRWNEDQRETIG